MDLYRILNVHSTASLVEIKASYRKLALLYHPDLHHHVKANKTDENTSVNKFKDITHAYHILSDAKRRAEYDATVGVGKHHYHHSTWNPAATYGSKIYRPHSSHSRTSNNVHDLKFDVKTWNAWHYGDGAVIVDAIRQTSSRFA